MKHLPPALSPSRLNLYVACPQLYAERYIDRIPLAPNVPMRFGQAVHKGLELHYRGEDGGRAFLTAWKAETAILTAAGIGVPQQLTRIGLDLVDKALALGLEGDPEKRFFADVPGTRAGVQGIVDLWCEADDLVVDWKTTQGRWTQERADAEVFQPALYSWAFFVEHDRWPRFAYVVLDRQSGSVQRFDTVRTEQQIEEVLTLVRQISSRIDGQDFACTCKSEQAHQKLADPTVELAVDLSPRLNLRRAA